MLTRSVACTFDFPLYFRSFPLDVKEAYIFQSLKTDIPCLATFLYIQ